MADSPLFSLRRLQSVSKDGRFRVYLSANDLRTLFIQPGDVCRLATLEGLGGPAIAWNSTDPATKNTKGIVLIPESLKDAYGFTLGDKVTVTKQNQDAFKHAEKVSISLDPEEAPLEASETDDEIGFWSKSSLASMGAVWPGEAFTVQLRKGPYGGRKRRFTVKKIEPAPESGSSPHVPYYCDHRSKILVEHAADAPSKPVAKPLGINSEGIGGLQRQLQQLNKRLAALNDDVRRLHVSRSPGIILHGPSGTGKSLIVGKIREAAWSKVLDASDLSPHVQSSSTKLRNIFADAANNQPSLVVIEGLDYLAGKVERGAYPSSSLASTLAAEMDRLKNTKVLVIGVTLELNEVDKMLRKPGRFRYEIEIPVPDSKARTEILRTLQTPDDIAQVVGERTHGFVGQDLEALYETAVDRAYERYENNEGFELVSHYSEGPPPYGDSPSHRVNADHASSVNKIDHPTGASPNGLNHGIVDGDHAPEDSSDASHYPDVRLEDFEAALLEVQPTAMREVFLETPKVRWADIGGSEDVKRALYKVTERPFKRPDLMRDLRLEPHRGILLYGPPGCSKTLCAKAVATESGLNFIAVKGAELTSMYVGESERAIREVFRKARAASPSIIFFDEIDSIGASREGGSHTSGLNVLTTLLNEMDGIESLKGVLVLAATNRPDILDSALLRPGRFDARIYVGPPNEDARKQILEIGTRGRPLADNVDLLELASAIDGYSGAEIIQICSEAAEACADEREMDGNEQASIGKQHFDRALKRIPRQITQDTIQRYIEWNAGTSTRL